MRQSLYHLTLTYFPYHNMLLIRSDKVGSGTCGKRSARIHLDMLDDEALPMKHSNDMLASPRRIPSMSITQSE